MFHILLSCDSQGSMECIYVCTFTLSLISALDGGGWSKPHPSHFETRYPFSRRLDMHTIFIIGTSLWEWTLKKEKQVHGAWTVPGSWYISINWFSVLWDLVVTLCTTRFKVRQFYILPTQCMYVFLMDLSTNSDYFPAQHELICFYQPWIFKHNFD